MRSLIGRAATIFLFALSLAYVAPGAHADGPASYVGGEVCSGCHAVQARSWKGSHHALAMQPATAATVLGDFAGTQLEHFGVTTTFFRDGEKFMVRADGPDGALHEYPIAYTFGVYPLQQYLIAMPGGRLQALGIAWDSRPKDQGGQRWFHLYPDQQLKPGDPLHWTGRDQTWNYQCADCHSTNLQKNYDLAANTYATSWTDVDVSCEACHGPGSPHVVWAKAHAEGGSYPSGTDDIRKGLTNWLTPTDNGHWDMNPDTGIARRTEKLASAELDTCAACHSRRKVIAKNPMPGEPYLDAYLPALLEPGLYHADGQIDGEVYEYGSFLQSRMHQAGVTCSDCHDPHSAKPRAEGNALCGQCHMPEKFDVAEHHHHQPGSTGAQCVNCHMPTKTYMVVDVRRDHSIRVPRPDLSVALGTPNACTQCHAQRSAMRLVARPCERVCHIYEYSVPFAPPSILDGLIRQVRKTLLYSPSSRCPCRTSCAFASLSAPRDRVKVKPLPAPSPVSAFRRRAAARLTGRLRSELGEDGLQGLNARG